MEQRIFDRLDALERGARIDTTPAQQTYSHGSASFSNDVGHESCYDYEESSGREYACDEDAFAHHAMILDSFDERLLGQAEHASRPVQAAFGSTRQLSLVELQNEDYERAGPRYRRQTQSHGLESSRFALEGGHRTASSSSPYNKQMPSSPLFHASQRRPPPVADVRRPRATPFTQDTSNSEYPSQHPMSDTHGYEVEDSRGVVPYQGRKQHFHADTPTQRAQPKPAIFETNQPVVQGISLVSTRALPDRFRAIFRFPLLNAVQSKVFDTIYNGNDNLVLSAPTGSGKTAVLELAICRLINDFASGSFKIVYQAPTKSLCSERQRDWQAKFGPLDLQCAELTGDTDSAQLRNVQHATIIITTPEKWDSMTRKWKDHQKLMQMVKLFLIDEVHILKDHRGATLEAVVSRMKSIGSDVRFVALSATVPNFQDLASWLGKNSVNPDLPAARERFGEEFRPVRLRKHVCGYQANANDFAFEKTLSAKLPEVISKYSQRKPIMVFCFTRNACVETAKLLASWWSTKDHREQYWPAPRKRPVVEDKDLRDTTSSGVAYHHAGLSSQDRTAVEKAYLEGDTSVICCTSTLAVGVNLPCHMIIIKNTVTYQNSAAGGCKEYSDLEIMQMLGRAGRPQFDDSAIAVIMTRQQRAPFYEKMISGQEVLESCLHLNLIDHLNAEIGLGTITSVSSAKKWLSGTFLFVRLKENPEHYRIQGDAPGHNLDERLENICSKGIALLEEKNLVVSSPELRCTEFGDAMARYYLQFETMKGFMSLPAKAKVSEILSSISQAAEFRDIRFRAGEKSSYKDLNKNGSIKFPIPVNLDVPAHKVSLVIQSVLGSIELPTENYKHRIEYSTARALIFQHVHRLIRCIIDCQLYLEDSTTTKNALMLARSLGAQVWDDSPLHMKQLESVGVVSVRKLVAAGITSIEELELTEAHRIETAMSKNPPFGSLLQEKAKLFPKLQVSLRVVGEPSVKNCEHVGIRLRAELGFLNDKIPVTFNKKPVYVCFLAETSDGHKVHFARISAKKLDKGQDILFSADLTNANQSVRAYVMCDEIAGTMRYANIKPDVPLDCFPPTKVIEDAPLNKAPTSHSANISRRRTADSLVQRAPEDASDEFGDDSIEDVDLTLAETGGFLDIDNFDETGDNTSAPKRKKCKTAEDSATNSEWRPQQLREGKWACNHACKDKTACKHLCCREGLDKKPNPPKAIKKKQMEPSTNPTQTQISMPKVKQSSSSKLGVENLAGSFKRVPSKDAESKESRELNRLHNSIQTATPTVPILRSYHARGGTEPARSNERRLSPRPLGLDYDIESEEPALSDYGLNDSELPDLPEAKPTVLSPRASTSRGTKRPRESSDNGVNATGALRNTYSSPQMYGESIGKIQADFGSSVGDETLDEVFARPFHALQSKLAAEASSSSSVRPIISPVNQRTRKSLLPFISSSDPMIRRVMHSNADSTIDEAERHAGTKLEAVHNTPLETSQATSAFERTASRQGHLTTGANSESHLNRRPSGEAEAKAATPVVQDAEQGRDLKTWFLSEFGDEHFNFVG